MIIYISGRYRGEDIEQVREHILIAERFAIKIWNKGHQAFCPHLNTRLFDEKGCHASNRDYIDFDLKIIQRCDAMFMLPNWKASVGAGEERSYALKIAMPVYYNLDDIPEGRDEGLEQLLDIYDELVAIERQRIIKSHKKYGNDWRDKDILLERYYEILDLFGYKKLQEAQAIYKEKNLNG